jgi:hypothetical protein
LHSPIKILWYCVKNPGHSWGFGRNGVASLSSKTIILNKTKKLFSVLNQISIIEPNKRKYSYNCDFLEFNFS